MQIRKATKDDLYKILAIYEEARKYMLETGNDQWGDTYPERDIVEKDLESKLYVCTENREILCVFSYAVEEDLRYQSLDTGKWLNEKPYGTVHRLASAKKGKGAAAFCLAYAFEQCKNIRLDTYKKNIPMQNLLNKCGFVHCGNFFNEGKEWMAYQKCKS